MSYHIHVYMCLMIILGVIVPFCFRPFSSLFFTFTLTFCLNHWQVALMSPNRFTFFEGTDKTPPNPSPLSHAQTRTQVILVGSLYQKFQTSKPNQTAPQTNHTRYSLCTAQGEQQYSAATLCPHTHIPHLTVEAHSTRKK